MEKVIDVNHVGDGIHWAIKYNSGREETVEWSNNHNAEGEWLKSGWSGRRVSRIIPAKQWPSTVPWNRNRVFFLLTCTDTEFELFLLCMVLGGDYL